MKRKAKLEDEIITRRDMIIVTFFQFSKKSKETDLKLYAHGKIVIAISSKTGNSYINYELYRTIKAKTANKKVTKNKNKMQEAYKNGSIRKHSKIW